MPLLLDNVKVNTSTTGTGSTIAIGAAVSTYDTPALAGAVNGLIYRIRIDDGNDWEIGTGVYDSATPAFTNRTVIRSTNSDAALDLSGSATVSVVASQLDIKMQNRNIAPTTANVTAVVGYRDFADLSGMTADRNYVLPPCQVDDEIELKIVAGDDTYELVIIGDTGVSIEGGTAATEWYRTNISNSSFRFVADAANSWHVINEGRVPSAAVQVELDRQVIGAGGGMFSFTGISQNYDHLRIIMSIQSDIVANEDFVHAYFNGDSTTANYRYLWTQDYSTYGSVTNDGYVMGYCAGSTAISVSDLIVDIFNYSMTTNEKKLWAFGDNRRTSTGQHFHIRDCVWWENTNAITQISILPDGYSTQKFTENSRAILYGIRTVS